MYIPCGAPPLTYNRSSLSFLSAVLICMAAVHASLPRTRITAQEPRLSPQELQALVQDIRNRSQFSTAATILGYATTLSVVQPLLKRRITLLIPDDTALAQASSPPAAGAIELPQIFQLHVIERNLNFSDLAELPVGTWLPTALPGYGLQILNNSENNLRLNNAVIVERDMCASLVQALVACQGINSILNATSLPSNPPLPFLNVTPPSP